MARFNDLPYELLEQIVLHLSPADRQRLVQINRFLNVLCVPSCFPNLSLRTQQEKLDYFEYSADLSKSLRAKKQWDELSYLSVAFDIKSIDTLKWSLDAVVLPNSPNSHHPEDIFPHYERLLRVLRRLDHVRCFTIKMEHCNCLQPDCIGTSHTSGPADRGSLLRRYTGQWEVMMNELLNLLAEKGCEELILEDGSYPLGQSGASSPGGKEKSSRDSSPHQSATTPRAPMRGSTSVNENGFSLSEKACQQVRIRHLVISSSMLLHHPCASWTRSLLRVAPIEQVDLDGVSLSHNEWKNVFGWMKHELRHKLSRLSIINCSQLPLGSLMEFITGLEELTTLTLLQDVPHIPARRRKQFQAKSPLSVPLPKLKYLHTYSDWVSLLCPEGADPRPSLSKIYIRPREIRNFFGERAFHYSRSAEHVSKVLRRLQPSPSSPAQLQGLVPQPHIHIGLDLSPKAESQTLISQYGDARDERMSPDRRAVKYHAYDLVSELIVSESILLRPWEPQCQYFALWKNTTCVKFQCDETRSRKSKNTPSLGEGQEEGWKKCIKQIWEPLLRSHAPEIKSFVCEAKTVKFVVKFDEGGEAKEGEGVDEAAR